MSSRRTIGGPVQFSDPHYVERCPKCFLVIDEECHGYGVAFGGGMGSYIVCPNPRCDWFIKELDSDE